MRASGGVSSYRKEMNDRNADFIADPIADPIVIVSAARTPMGGFQGDFASLAGHGNAQRWSIWFDLRGIPERSHGQHLSMQCGRFCRISGQQRVRLVS